MSYQLTIRIDDDLNEKAIEQADKLGVTRASLIRRALNSYLNKSNPNEDSEVIDILKEELAKAHVLIQDANEAKSRSDTIIMQLTKQLEHSQLQLEDLTKPQTFIQKLRAAFG